MFNEEVYSQGSDPKKARAEERKRQTREESRMRALMIENNELCDAVSALRDDSDHLSAIQEGLGYWYHEVNMIQSRLDYLKKFLVEDCGLHLEEPKPVARDGCDEKRV